MRWLSRFRVEDHLAEPAAWTAIWLTGQSSMRHSRLSPAQATLLEQVALIGFHPLRAGLPFNRAAMTVEYRREPLGPASVRNGAQYLAATLGRRFGREVATHLQPVLDLTSERLLVLCGSAGAQLLSSALPHLVRPPELGVWVVGLGPVGRLEAPDPRWRVHVVQGDRDRVSRWGYRGPVDLVVPGGHLDYAAHPLVRAEVLRVAGLVDR